jgi:hypothetical protein
MFYLIGMIASAIFVTIALASLLWGGRSAKCVGAASIFAAFVGLVAVIYVVNAIDVASDAQAPIALGCWLIVANFVAWVAFILMYAVLLLAGCDKTRRGEAGEGD